MNKLLIALLPAAFFTGCSTIEYDCKLKEIAAAKCSSMTESYDIAVKTTGSKARNSQSIFEGRTNAGGKPEQQTSDKPFFKGEDSGYTESGERGMPVFKQPEVHRVWVAPFVDGDGNLHSGEYTYFSTPGQWNYGTTKRAGEGSGIFGPAKPGNLGFTPATAPPSPRTPAVPPSTPTSSSSTKGAPVPGDNVDGITQPMQRLTQ